MHLCVCVCVCVCVSLQGWAGTAESCAWRHAKPVGSSHSRCKASGICWFAPSVHIYNNVYQVKAWGDVFVAMLKTAAAIAAIVALFQGASPQHEVTRTLA